MDIKLVSFADKVTGATDATGKVSSDDINQLKKVLNGVVSALFDLDNSNTATTEVVKTAALPDVDIYDGIFNTSDFVVSGGLISLSNGSSLPVAPALTAGIVNDSADTFTATLPTGFAATDVERTFDGGVTWAAITALPINVGNVAFAIGKVGLRIKATSERQHSATLYNQSAFTSSSGGNPDADFVQILSLTVDPDITKTGNSLSWVYSGSPNDYRFFSCDTLKVSQNTPFEVRFTVDPTQSSGQIGISQLGQGYTFGRIFWNRSSDFHGNFLTFQNGNYGQSGGVDITTPPRGRIKGDGTNITIDYSLDGGATWTQIDSCAQPAEDLQFRGGFTYANGITQNAIVNLVEKGMVTV